MAWNPSPEVAVLRDAATRFGWERVVLVAVRKDGRLQGASYGETRALCTATKPLMDAAFDAVYAKLETE